MKIRLLYLMGLTPFLTDWLERGAKAKSFRELVSEMLICPLLLGMAWWAIREHDKILEISKIDSLTGLFNSGTFHKALAEGVEHSSHRHNNLCLAFIDLDHFKNINDKHGHETGNRVLKDFSELVLEETQKQGITCFRVGGDEFAIIFSGLKKDESLEILSRIRRRSLEAPLSLQTWGASLSAGLAEFKGDERPQQLLQRADHLMYKAKQNGKNKIEC